MVTKAKAKDVSVTSVQLYVLMTYNVEFEHSYKIPKYCIFSTIIIPHEMLCDLCNILTKRQEAGLTEE